MAIGVISSPSSWALGTVLSPIWAQNVQDNINQSLRNITQGQTSQCSLTKGAAVGGLGAFVSAGSCFDICGSVQVTGTSAGVSGIVGTVTFVTNTMSTSTFTNGPVVLLTPLSSAAATLPVASGIYCIGTQSGGFWTGFTINTAGTASLSGAAWNYLVFMC